MTKQNEKVEELQEQIQELQKELEKVKQNKTGEAQQKEVEEIQQQAEDAVDNSGLSRRKFLKALGGGAGALGAAALLPNAAGFTFKDNKPFKFGNLSSTNPNLEVGTDGNLDLHGNNITNTGAVGTDSNPVNQIHSQSLNTEYTSSGSNDADVILTKDAGTIYAVGMDGVIAEGADAVTVAQQAYDDLAQTMGGHFRFGPYEWTFSEAFEHWQSGVQVTAPGARIRPDGSYTGYLIKWYTIDGQTTTGDPGNIYNTYLDHIWIECQGQAKGIMCETLLTSAMGPNVYVHDANGAGLRLSSTIRHCNFFSPKLRYCGSSGEAALHIEPITSLSWERDGTNNVFFWAPSIVYGSHCHINVTSDLTKTDRPDREINFWGGQVHGNAGGSYGRTKIQDFLVKIHGAHGVYFDGTALRAGRPQDGTVSIDTGPDGTVPDSPQFQSVSFDQGGSAALVFSTGPDGTVHVTDCAFGEGQGSEIDKVANWGSGDFDVVWDNNSWASDNPLPFVGTAPNIIGRSQDKRIIEGWAETWDDSRLNKRSVGQSLVKRADLGASSGPSERMLQPVPRYFVREGAPSLDPTTNYLQLPDGSSTRQSVASDMDFLASEGSWEFDVEIQSTPSTGFVNIMLWYYDPNNKIYLLVRSDGTVELKSDDGGSTSVVVSGSLSLDTSPHTFRVSRGADGAWELFIDGVSQGTATDGTLPPRPRSTRIDNTMDAAVNLHEMVFY